MYVHVHTHHVLYGSFLFLLCPQPCIIVITVHKVLQVLLQREWSVQVPTGDCSQWALYTQTTNCRLIVYIFHPSEPFVISIQKAVNDYVVCFHFRNCFRKWADQLLQEHRLSIIMYIASFSKRPANEPIPILQFVVCPGYNNITLPTVQFHVPFLVCSLVWPAKLFLNSLCTVHVNLQQTCAIHESTSV